MISKVIKKLNDAKDVKYQEFSSSLNPTALLMLGVRIPILRKIAKEIVNEDAIKFLETNPMDCFELLSLQAMVIGYMKEDLSVVLHYTRLFIPFVSDWSVNDTLCQTFTIAKKYPKEVWNFLSDYFNSVQEFELRVVVVMMLCHFITDEYVEKVISFIDKTKNDGYYYKMGCAWCLQVIMVKYPNICYQYLLNNNLDDWTHNKAISKMIESYRVSNDMKDKIKKLKRK